MRLKNTFLLLLCLTIGMINARAQSRTLTDVSNYGSRSAGAIISGKEVIGYYVLFKAGQIDKETSLYKLIITDENFTTVKEHNIKSYIVAIIDATFNGDVLAFKFIGVKDKKYRQEIRLFDKAGNELPPKYSSDPMYWGISLEAAKTQSDKNVELFSLPNVGFINFTPIKTGGLRVGYKVQMFPVNADSTYKPWVYKTSEKSLETISFIGSNKDVVFVNILNMEKVTDREPLYTFGGIDIKSGKLIFKKQFSNEAYNFSAINLFPVNDNESVLFGLLIDAEVGKRKAKVVGMQSFKINNEGNIISDHAFLWSDIARDFQPTDEDGKPIDLGNLTIHKVVVDSDGKIYAIGERFYKAASAAGIASKVLNQGGTSVVKIVVAELVILELDKDLKPIKVDFIDKGRRSVDLPAGYGGLGAMYMAGHVSSVGGFDVYFVQERNDREGFTITYRSRETKAHFINTISIYEGERTTDKIAISTNANYFRVEPAKPGYISMGEYFSKEKKLSYKLIRYKD